MSTLKAPFVVSMATRLTQLTTTTDRWDSSVAIFYYRR